MSGRFAYIVLVTPSAVFPGHIVIFPVYCSFDPRMAIDVARKIADSSSGSRGAYDWTSGGKINVYELELGVVARRNSFELRQARGTIEHLPKGKKLVYSLTKKDEAWKIYVSPRAKRLYDGVDK